MSNLKELFIPQYIYRIYNFLGGFNFTHLVYSLNSRKFSFLSNWKKFSFNVTYYLLRFFEKSNEHFYSFCSLFYLVLFVKTHFVTVLIWSLYNFTLLSIKFLSFHLTIFTSFFKIIVPFLVRLKFSKETSVVELYPISNFLRIFFVTLYLDRYVNFS